MLKHPPKSLPSSQATSFFKLSQKDWIFFQKKCQKPSSSFVLEPRLLKALEFGISIKAPGYHMYVSGPSGTGKGQALKAFLKKKASLEPSPLDWVYVHNFEQPENPQLLCLPIGEGKSFKHDMEDFILTLSLEIPQALQSKDYESSTNQIMQENRQKKNYIYKKLETLAKKKEFGIKSHRVGIATIPIVKGKMLTEKEYSKLPQDEKNRIEEERAELEPVILEFARKLRTIEKKLKKDLKEIERKTAESVLKSSLEPLREQYKNDIQISNYLKKLKVHLLDNLSIFSIKEEKSDEPLLSSDPYLPYRVNLFIDNTHTIGSPVIFEDNPTFYNLFGKIEKNIEYGVYTTDFKMIKSGSLARAQGGYLILYASHILKNLNVWDSLKRFLKNQKLSIEDFGEQLSILATSGLRPEPMKIDTKVIIVGTERMYRMLSNYDEDFQKLFKIKAEFSAEVPRDHETLLSFLSILGNFCYEQKINLSQDAVEALLEEGIRIVGDHDALSGQVLILQDRLLEAAAYASSKEKTLVTRLHIEEARQQRLERMSLGESHLFRGLFRGDLNISVNGESSNSINALVVYQSVHHHYGIPGRLTCRTFKGKPGIINIERESSLSGKLHNKGIQILTGWLNGTFAKVRPISFGASICFEQSYGPIDGDSASLAQILLLLCCIGEFSIPQSIALTGSMNQLGDIQPIGGINEKIQGFFKVCEHYGLTGKQGIIFPYQNIRNLMLPPNIREAIDKGLFSLWPVKTVEEAFFCLTGHIPGKWSPKTKSFTRNSAFEKIYKNLKSSKHD